VSFLVSNHKITMKNSIQFKDFISNLTKNKESNDNCVSNLELNKDFKKTLKIMNKTNNSLLVTGKAGTGKSTLLKYFVEHTKKNVVVCAPTGIAALNINGQTIHSFFRFPPKLLDYNDVKNLYNFMYKEIDTIIIDEISMVRADILDAIDIFMKLNGKDKNKSFGGVQMIFFGDLYQLPPIVGRNIERLLYTSYKSPYFFDSKVIKDLSFDIIELTKVYRQKDINFINFLDKVRLGDVNEKSLDFINLKVNNKPIRDFITLTPTNFVADTINNKKLLEISNELFTYNARTEGNFKLEAPAPSELKLKKDALVIFVKNDKDKRWVNGTLGKVVECKNNYVKVKINNHIVEVYPVDWDKIKYEYDKYTKRITIKIGVGANNTQKSEPNFR